jgi:hypothetical protein
VRQVVLSPKPRQGLISSSSPLGNHVTFADVLRIGLWSLLAIGLLTLVALLANFNEWPPNFQVGSLADWIAGLATTAAVCLAMAQPSLLRRARHQELERSAVAVAQFATDQMRFIDALLRDEDARYLMSRNMPVHALLLAEEAITAFPLAELGDFDAYRLVLGIKASLIGLRTLMQELANHALPRDGVNDRLRRLDMLMSGVEQAMTELGARCRVRVETRRHTRDDLVAGAVRVAQDLGWRWEKAPLS